MEYQEVSVDTAPVQKRDVVKEYAGKKEVRYAVAWAVWETRDESGWSLSTTVRDKVIEMLGWSDASRRATSDIIALLKSKDVYGFLEVTYPSGGLIAYALSEKAKECLAEGPDAFEGELLTSKDFDLAVRLLEREAAAQNAVECCFRIIRLAGGYDSVKGEYVRQKVLEALGKERYKP